MKKNKVKIWVCGGLFCILLILVSSWYAVTMNDSHLVVPTDFENYSFRIKDLPMIISISLTCVYVFALFIMLFIGIGRRQRHAAETNTTLSLNPKLGITFAIILIELVILCQVKLFGSLEYTLIAAIIVLSLALALGIFLSEYLLYRYDHDDHVDESGE